MAEAIFAAGNTPARPATLPPADLVGQLKPIEAALRAASLVLGDDKQARPLVDAAASRLLVACGGLATDTPPPAGTLDALQGIETLLQGTMPLLDHGAPPWLLVDDALGRLLLACDGLHADDEPAGEMLAQTEKRNGGQAMKARSGATTEVVPPTLAQMGITKKPDEPAPYFTADVERLRLVLSAGSQIDGLMGLLIAAGADPAPDPDALLGVAVRVRDLAGAVVFGLSDEGDDIEHLHEQVLGRRRATERAAS